MSMSWQMAALLLLGGSTVLLFVGMPVAISFIAINVIGAILFSEKQDRADHIDRDEGDRDRRCPKQTAEPSSLRAAAARPFARTCSRFGCPGAI